MFRHGYDGALTVSFVSKALLLHVCLDTSLDSLDLCSDMYLDMRLDLCLDMGLEIWLGMCEGAKAVSAPVGQC